MAVVGDNRGGFLHDDLRQAFFGALGTPRDTARTRAMEFSWAQAAHQFVSHLVPSRAGPDGSHFVTQASQLT